MNPDANSSYLFRLRRKFKGAIAGTPLAPADLSAKRNRPLETSRRFFGFSIFQPLPEADAMRWSNRSGSLVATSAAATAAVTTAAAALAAAAAAAVATAAAVTAAAAAATRFLRTSFVDCQRAAL